MGAGAEAEIGAEVREKSRRKLRKASDLRLSQSHRGRWQLSLPAAWDSWDYRVALLVRVLSVSKPGRLDLSPPPSQ